MQEDPLVINAFDPGFKVLIFISFSRILMSEITDSLIFIGDPLSLSTISLVTPRVLFMELNLAYELLILIIYISRK